MKVMRHEHDACLRACWRIREQVASGERTAAEADDDLVALGVVAGAFACGEPVTQEQWSRAARLAGFGGHGLGG
jgi:hypothetical protein